MILDRKSLVELLPAIYRLRDHEEGEPLTRLLSVIAEQIEVLQENLDQLYDDQFIETCAEWVVPYIGDLVGARGMRDVRATGFSTRAFVANTIAYRRRKGTASMLEQLARDLTGWNAAVVEFFLRLGWTQNLNHIRMDAPVWLGLRDSEGIERIRTPFERAMRTVDVRRIRSGRGTHNIPNIGIFLWRIEAYSLSSSPAFHVDVLRWMFSPLGQNTPLFSMPQTETEITHLAERVNVPMPITRRALARDVSTWYGDPGSILVRLGGVPVGAANIESCDLSDIGPTWDHVPAPVDLCSIDPVLGRLALPKDPSGVTIEIGPNDTIVTRLDAHRYSGAAPGNDPFVIRVGGVPVDASRIRLRQLNPWIEPEVDVLLFDPSNGRMLFPFDPAVPRVTYHYGAVADLGGGEYEREASLGTIGTTRIEIPRQQPTIVDALTALGTNSGVIEITDSGRYEQDFDLTLAAGQRIELRSRNGARPTLVLTKDITITGDAGAEATLNGFLIAGGGVLVANSELRVLRIRHCTLVPGPAVSITVAATKSLLSLELEKTITGPIDMHATAGTLVLRDCIVDAPNLAVPAIGVQGGGNGPRATIERCTIFGLTNVEELTLGSESIFTDLLTAARKQVGCVRFSYVLRNSRTPRRYRCQPELAAREAVEARKRELAPVPITQAEIDAITKQIHERVRPEFVSRTYGTPAYAQLARSVHHAITNGAEDGSEMGAYCGVEAARRVSNFRGAVDEFLRFGLEAGIFYAS